MSNTYEALFQSIRAKCRKRHWFGPDYDDPHQYDGILEYDPHFDVHTIQRIAADDPRRFGFVFPPASEEILQRTETQLGFALPPLLRALYAQVANGGFGPVLGIRGILDGYGRPGASIYWNSDDTVVACYPRGSDTRKVALSEFDGQWSKYDSMYVPAGVWLDKLLSICDMGCVSEMCVAGDEQMFHRGAAESDDYYYLARMSITLEEWLWGWVNDDFNIVNFGKTEGQEKAV